MEKENPMGTKHWAENQIEEGTGDILDEAEHPLWQEKSYHQIQHAFTHKH